MGFAFEISKLVKNYTPLLNIIAKTITIGKLLKKKKLEKDTFVLSLTVK